MPRFFRLRDVVDFVAASLISYYGYANSFSDGPCRHPNSEWLQRRFLSPPELCRSLSQARGKQTTSRFSICFFFFSTATHTFRPCVRFLIAFALPPLPSSCSSRSFIYLNYQTVFRNGSYPNPSPASCGPEGQIIARSRRGSPSPFRFLFSSSLLGS